MVLLSISLKVKIIYIFSLFEASDKQFFSTFYFGRKSLSGSYIILSFGKKKMYTGSNHIC